MKLDHLAMYVKDLEAVRTFFMHYFGAFSNEIWLLADRVLRGMDITKVASRDPKEI